MQRKAGRSVRAGGRLSLIGVIALAAIVVPSAQAGATARSQHAAEVLRVQPVMRTVTFVHGINGDYRNFRCSDLTGSFVAILVKVCADPAFTGESFPYYQDLGYASPGTTPPPCPNMPPPDTNTGFLFVDPDAINPDLCDSKGALAFSAAALHDHLTKLKTPDTVLANSMGGAIARGWLAISQLNGSGDRSLAHADSVVFLQGAQAGSWAARAGEAIASVPGVAPIARRISQLIHLDVDRPGVMDVTPSQRGTSV